MSENKKQWNLTLKLMRSSGNIVRQNWCETPSVFRLPERSSQGWTAVEFEQDADDPFLYHEIEK